jgi:hypothetical protein
VKKLIALQFLIVVLLMAGGPARAVPPAKAAKAGCGCTAACNCGCAGTGWCFCRYKPWLASKGYTTAAQQQRVFTSWRYSYWRAGYRPTCWINRTSRLIVYGYPYSVPAPYAVPQPYAVPYAVPTPAPAPQYIQAPTPQGSVLADPATAAQLGTIAGNTAAINLSLQTLIAQNSQALALHGQMLGVLGTKPAPSGPVIITPPGSGGGSIGGGIVAPPSTPGIVAPPGTTPGLVLPPATAPGLPLPPASAPAIPLPPATAPGLPLPPNTSPALPPKTMESRHKGRVASIWHKK